MIAKAFPSSNSTVTSGYLIVFADGSVMQGKLPERRSLCQADFCEFIESPVEPVAPEFKGRRKLLFPVWLMDRIADSDRISEVRNLDAEYIRSLAEDVKLNGIRESLTVWYDSNANIRLQDGYHRYCAGKDIGLEFWPVKLVWFESIRSRSSNRLS